MRVLKRVGFAASSTMLALSSILVGFAGVAHASGAPYTCTWTGADPVFSTFSEDDNWSGCNGHAPQPNDYDNLIFNNTSLTNPGLIQNDITNLKVTSITFNGTNTSYADGLSGNAITVTGNVTDNTTLGYTSLGLPLIISGNVTFASDSSTHFDELDGSGNVNVTSGASEFRDLSSYTGTLSSSNARIQLSTYTTFTSSATVLVSNAAVLTLQDENARDAQVTYDLPISLGGDGIGKAGALDIESGQGDGEPNTTTLTGPLTLTSNVEVTSDDNDYLDITSLISYNGHTFKSVGSNVTTITVPAGSDESSSNPAVGSGVAYYVDGKVGQTTVAKGGLLKGNGTLASANIENGGVLSPGHSPGCLTVTGTLHQGGTYQAQLGGTTACSGYDQMIVDGNVVLDDGNVPAVRGVLDVSLVNGFVPTVGQTFEIINNQGSQSISDTFANLPEGTVFSINGHAFKISYKGGDGNDVVVTAVNTPATPDTGFAARSNQPIVIGVGIVAMVGSAVLLSRRLVKKSQ